jgi:hypothetical protein
VRQAVQQRAKELATNYMEKQQQLLDKLLPAQQVRRAAASMQQYLVTFCQQCGGGLHLQHALSWLQLCMSGGAAV